MCFEDHEAQALPREVVASGKASLACANNNDIERSVHMRSYLRQTTLRAALDACEVLTENLGVFVPGGKIVRMESTGDYCAYEKAVEHLADRWILLIGREIAIHGSRGFNALADSLPGISRSVLSRRLRKMQDFGLIVREQSDRPRLAPYRLAPAGENLVPTLMSLNSWAERFVPEDPAAVQHDPDVIQFWLMRRVDVKASPDPPAVIVLQLGGPTSQAAWLVVGRGAAASLCIEDPLLPSERYVYVDGGATALFPVSRGLRGWEDAIRDRTVALFGDPDLVRALPEWFLPAESSVTASSA
jgi:DNA-binding HxlR family transcriptional regulator